MERAEVLGALEAILFVAGEPMGASDLKRIVERYWADLPEDVRGEGPPDIGGLLDELRQRWSDESARGFTLVSVAGGYTFRSNPRFAGVLQAMQTQRPVRLSRAAIETLAIIAYRQPITKPEVDHIRGVDCGSAIRLLLDRQLVRIVGKREEAGRPLLYGTSKQFLSFFNLPNLNQLPTLRELTELNELSEESRAELGDFEELVGSVAGTQPVDLSVKNEPSIEALDQAMQDLKERQRRAAEAFLAEGITL
jgi:segregation and condensation protein B